MSCNHAGYKNIVTLKLIEDRNTTSYVLYNKRQYVSNIGIINTGTIQLTPSSLSLCLTFDPPPRPMLTTSGIRKLVVTPPTLILVDASLGNPPIRQPASEVVPPMSITMASFTPS